MMPVLIIGINAYRDGDIVLRVRLSEYTTLPQENYYYILRRNRSLESYQGDVYNAVALNWHYYFKKTYKKASTVISDEDYNYFVKTANDIVERTFLECLGDGQDWQTFISYNGKTYTTPAYDPVGNVKELLYKVTGLSSIPFENREKYFRPENGSFADYSIRP